MVVAVSVCGSFFFAVHLRQPIVRDRLAGGVENEAADGVALVRVRVDAPIRLLHVLFHSGDRVNVNRQNLVLSMRGLRLYSHRRLDGRVVFVPG